MSQEENIFTLKYIYENMGKLSLNKLKRDTGFNYELLYRFAKSYQGNKRIMNPTYSKLIKISIAMQKQLKEMRVEDE